MPIKGIPLLLFCTRIQNHVIMKKQTEKRVKALEIMRNIIILRQESGELIPEEVMPFVEIVQRMLGLETPLQAMFLAAFVNNMDDQQIDISDLAMEFGVQPIVILSEISEIDYLVDKGIVISKSFNGRNYYNLASNVLPALKENRLPAPDEQVVEMDVAEEENEKRYNNLIHYEDIEEKELFFADNVKEDVDRLRDLLQKETMENVMQRLSEHKMRRCFTCILYGDPGTGKTETVRQLARASKRDLFMVDIPSIRSKWVGGTEKNIKALFVQYREAVKKNDVAPILLFNEADALLNRRNGHSSNSVDKMENAMQDIILQEMESLEGIMIATTNITAALDDAFERRFLYKIRYEQPTAEARREIWRSMLPELSDDVVKELAEQYRLSGGEIENIARKYIIDNIINGKDDNPTLLSQFCRKEKYTKGNVMKRMGFNIGLEENL